MSDLNHVVNEVDREAVRAAQRQALHYSRGAWKAGDHPQLADGGAAYVARIRSESDLRLETLVTWGSDPSL